MENQPDMRSWWQKIFGRSLLKAIVGDFFADKNNAASVIAITLVLTLAYIIIVDKQFEAVSGLLNVVFVVIGYYFGSKREKADEEYDEE
jgi:hypothetical protein